LVNAPLPLLAVVSSCQMLPLLSMPYSSAASASPAENPTRASAGSAASEYFIMDDIFVLFIVFPLNKECITPQALCPGFLSSAIHEVRAVLSKYVNRPINPFPKELKRRSPELVLEGYNI